MNIPLHDAMNDTKEEEEEEKNKILKLWASWAVLGLIFIKEKWKKRKPVEAYIKPWSYHIKFW